MVLSISARTRNTSVDVVLSKSLFARSIPGQKEMDKVESKTRKRMEIAQKNYSSLMHDIFDSKHYMFSPSIKERVKQITAIAANKIDIARNVFHTKLEKLTVQYQSEKITYTKYIENSSLSMTNADLAEAMAYEEAIKKIIKLTKLTPKYAGDNYDFTNKTHK